MGHAVRQSCSTHIDGACSELQCSQTLGHAVRQSCSTHIDGACSELQCSQTLGHAVRVAVLTLMGHAVSCNACRHWGMHRERERDAVLTDIDGACRERELQCSQTLMGHV